ncbi:tyrosine integrase [Gordonia phage GEazy]|nr:tyrosine integrase [Gordonia phage GEazy]QDF16752.1 tyrosine integrase [Gordonia phage HannahD]
MNVMPGGQYGNLVSHLDDHCRWMMRAGRGDRTIKLRRMHLEYLSEFIKCDPFVATEAQLEQWQDSLPRQQIRIKTSYIRPYYTWAHARGLRPDNPAALLVTPDARRTIPRPISTDDLALAVRLATPRMRAWMLLAAYGGLRAKEIAHLMVEDFIVDGECVYIHLRRTKGEVERMTAIPFWVWEAIMFEMPAVGPCWRRLRGTGPVTPQQICQATNLHLHACGVRSTLHTLRHWAGTQAVDSTDNLRLAQEYLGHRNPEMTAGYSRVRPKRLSAMVERFERIDLTSDGDDCQVLGSAA